MANTPKVGDGGTVHYPSMRLPCTVVEVSKSGKTVKVQRDLVSYDKGQVSGFKPDSRAEVKTYSLRKDGKWRPKGTRFPVLTIGERDHYIAQEM